MRVQNNNRNTPESFSKRHGLALELDGMIAQNARPNIGVRSQLNGANQCEFAAINVFIPMVISESEPKIGAFGNNDGRIQGRSFAVQFCVGLGLGAVRGCARYRASPRSSPRVNRGRL